MKIFPKPGSKITATVLQVTNLGAQVAVYELGLNANKMHVTEFELNNGFLIVHFTIDGHKGMQIFSGTQVTISESKANEKKPTLVKT